MTSSSNNDRWLTLGICIFLAALVWVVFGQTIHFGFVNFDDDVYVYKNPHVAGGLNSKDISWAFTHVHSSNWHPMTWMSHMLDCQLYGLNPGGHHLTNILLHTATVVLLFLVLRQMTGFTWRCALVAALFAVHPLRVESVVWIAERKDVLSGLFFVLTIGAYVAYVRHLRSIFYYGLTILTIALALMSKPMVVTLPFVLLLLDCWPLRRLDQPDGKTTFWRLIIEKIPLLVLVGAVCVITAFAQKEAMSSPPISLRLANALVSYVTYLEQMISPSNLAVLYPFPDHLALWRITIAAIVLLVISIATIAMRRRQPWLLFGWLWYLVMLLPVIGILQVGAQAHADRYTYLPQIGLYIALAWTLADLCGGRLYRTVALSGLSAAVLVTLTFLARIQTGYWQSSETLWTHDLTCTADNLTADINYGNVLLEKGKIDKAVTYYQKALHCKSDDADANVSLGYALVQQGKGDQAVLYLQKALEIKPDNPEAHNDLGIISFEKGNTREAIAHFAKALQARPDYAEACYNYGNALFQQGDMDHAVARYQQALQIKADYVEARYNLGNALFQEGKIDDAILNYQQAIQAKPNYMSATYNLGMAFKQKGRTDDAIAQFRRALELQPGSAETCYNLGNVLVQKGDEAEGITNLQRAVKIKPDFPDALNDLAWELATGPLPSLRNGKQAVELSQRANRLADGKDVDVLDTLAAAYAEAGQFAEAVQTLRNAIDMAQAAGQADRLKQFNTELQKYEANQPFHREAK
jgi:tetratricopeptide (TPR) repeat protein